MAKSFLLLLVLMLAFQSTVLAGEVLLKPGAQSYEVHNLVDVLEDTQGSLTIEDLVGGSREKHFREPTGKLSSFGYTDSAYWFRFTIVNPSPVRPWFIPTM